MTNQLIIDLWRFIEDDGTTEQFFDLRVRVREALADPEPAKTQPMLTLSQASMLYRIRKEEPTLTRTMTNDDLIASFTDEEREEFNDYGGTPQSAKTPSVYMGALPDGATAEPVGVAREDFEGPMSPQDI